MDRLDKPWAKRVLDALVDGEWHDYAEVMNEAISEVEDEYGLDVGSYYKKYGYDRRGKAVPKGIKEGTILAGKRIIVSRSIVILRNRRIVEVDSESQGFRRNKPTHIRLRPES